MALKVAGVAAHDGVEDQAEGAQATTCSGTSSGWAGRHEQAHRAQLDGEAQPVVRTAASVDQLPAITVSRSK